MNKKEQTYLDEVVPRLKEYKKPSKDQKEIIKLADIDNRTDLQEKQLVMLINVQLKIQELKDARQKASAIEKEKKNIERKKETRRKIIWGSALKTASKSDPQMAQIMQKLFDGGYIDEKQKELVRSDLKSKQQNDNQTIQQPIHQLANFNRN